MRRSPSLPNLPFISSARSMSRPRRKNDNTLLLTPPLTPSSSIRTAASLESHPASATATTSAVDRLQDTVESQPGDPEPTRLLLVGNVVPSVSTEALNAAVHSTFASLNSHVDSDGNGPVKGVFVRYLEKGVVILAFHNLKDAIEAKSHLATLSDGPLAQLIADNQAHFTCQFIAVEQLVDLLGHSGFLKSMDASFKIAVEGQPSLEDAAASLSIEDTEAGPDQDSAKRPVNVPMLKSFLESHGPLRSFDLQSLGTFRVEFFDIRDSVTAFDALHDVTIFGMKLRVFGRDGKPTSDTISDQPSFPTAGQLSQTRERFVVPTGTVADPPESTSPVPAVPDTGTVTTTEDTIAAIRPLSTTDDRSMSPAYFYNPTVAPQPETTAIVRQEDVQESNSSIQPTELEAPSQTPCDPRPSTVAVPPLAPLEISPYYATQQIYSPLSSPEGGAVHHYYAPPATPQVPFHPPPSYVLHPQAAATTVQPMFPPHHPGNVFTYEYDPHHAACQSISMGMGMVAPWTFDSNMNLVYPTFTHGSTYPGTEYWCPTINPTTGIPHSLAPYVVPISPPPLTHQQQQQQMNGLVHNHGQQPPSYFPPVHIPTDQAQMSMFSNPNADPGLEHSATIAIAPTAQESVNTTSQSHYRHHTHLQARQYHHPTVQASSTSGPDSQADSHAGGVSKDVSERNQLNLSKIEDGQDTRTTIMIKNIPNKMSDKDLISYINKVVPRRIDFLYLRMDFSNGCNVGYAFVNFITVQDLLTFAKKCLGEKWNMFSSEKVLQMSYANYQGKEALVEKFKNSCIMDEREAWQPKIFYSEPGPEQGLPEPFPAATHQRRKERSSHNRGALYVPGGVVGSGGGHGGLLHHANFGRRHHHHQNGQQERAEKGNGKHRKREDQATENTGSVKTDVATAP